MSIDLPEIEAARSRISEVAAEMLRGEQAYIDGSRAILGLVGRARVDHLSEPFVGFVAIDSETDEVPIGALREKWHPESRLKLQPEWDRAEAYAKDVGEPTCRDTIAWLAANPVTFENWRD